MTAYLQVTMTIDPADRAAGARIYSDHKQEFLDTVPGAKSKELLVRDEDVQVLHGFETVEQGRRLPDQRAVHRQGRPGPDPVAQGRSGHPRLRRGLSRDARAGTGSVRRTGGDRSRAGSEPISARK